MTKKLKEAQQAEDSPEVAVAAEPVEPLAEPVAAPVVTDYSQIPEALTPEEVEMWTRLYSLKNENIEPTTVNIDNNKDKDTIKVPVPVPA